MDNEKLSTAVRQASEMNERLIGELKLEKQKTKELLATVSQLEQSIKKASTSIEIKRFIMTACQSWNYLYKR